MKTVKNVLIIFCCAVLFFSSIAASAEVKKPERADNPKWQDVWDIRDYVSDQVYNLSEFDFYQNDSDREEVSSHRKPGLPLFSVEKEVLYSSYDNFNAPGGIEPDTPIGDALKSKYDGLYDAGMALVNSKILASGTYYTDDLFPEWIELGAKDGLLWDRIDNGSIQVIEDGEAPPEGVEWVYRNALNIYGSTIEAIFDRAKNWGSEVARSDLQTAIDNLKKALDDLHNQGNFVLELSQSMPDTGIYVGNSGKNDTTATVYEMWKPTTPDEIKRYACMGKEIIQITQASDNAYPVKMINVMQGPKCFDSFEAVLGDYTIGRTYDIYPYGNKVYDAEQKVELTVKIPEAVYNANRKYKMICVTKDGKPIIYDDLDKNPETITIRTNTFYAYALIYK